MDDRLKTNLKRIAEVGSKSYSLIIKSKAIRDQIVTAFLTQRTVEEIAIAERIARILDRDEEFPIPTTHNF
jgi:predicted transcriptional regulator